MSDIRRFGPDLAFHEWHRPTSLSRFVAGSERFGMVDIDCVEYCKECNEILRIYETAVDVGQEYKTATVTERAARKMGVASGVVLYTLKHPRSTERCGACSSPIHPTNDDITAFRIRSLTPNRSPWVAVTPQRFAERIAAIFGEHECPNAPRVRHQPDENELEFLNRIGDECFTGPPVRVPA